MLANEAIQELQNTKNKTLTFNEIKNKVHQLELELIVIFDGEEAFFEAINEDEDSIIELPWPSDWPEYITIEFLDQINIQWTIA